MTRKYRQQGYQDADRGGDRGGDRDDRPRQPSQAYQNLTTEEKIQRRSLRRATERSANEVLRCPSCGRGIQEFGTIVSGSTCPHCSAALHCCTACRHFDTAARWQCHAPIESPVEGKRHSNECALYEPRLVLDSTGRRSAPNSGGRGGTRRSSNDPKSQFEDLFKR